MAAPTRTKTTKQVTRVPAAKLIPEALAMRERGMTIPQIAKKLKRSERYVSSLFAQAKLDGTGMVYTVPDPIPLSQLPPEVRERTYFTADGFEKFFNAYSGMVLSSLHKSWVREALSENRVLINCPPRHAKSEIFSVWFPIWLICRDRDIQILVCSQTDALAKKMTNKIAHHLTSNDKLISDFGRFKPEMEDWPWRPASGYLMVEGRNRDERSGDPTIQVRGAGQQILGMEANVIIVDDPVSRQVAKSETDRAKMSEWFHGDVMSRLQPKKDSEGRVLPPRAVVIGQRLHIHDLYGQLASEKTTISGAKKAWHHINYPAILDWDKKIVLWPEERPWDLLMQVYQDVGADIFESMYQQNPLPAGRQLARTEWIYGDDTHPGCVDITRSVGTGLFNETDTLVSALAGQQTPDESIVRVLSIDPSPTRFAGCIVADIPKSETQFKASIVELRRDKMSVRDMVNYINYAIDAYSPQYFIFEQVAAQRWFLQDQAMDSIRNKLTVLPHTTGRNKADPTLGVESLAVDFEFGRIRLPYGDAESKAMSEMLFTEARQYPQGETDDLLMALWFIKYNYIRLLPRGSNSSWGGRAGFAAPPRVSNGWGWALKARQQSLGKVK